MNLLTTRTHLLILNVMARKRAQRSKKKKIELFQIVTMLIVTLTVVALVPTTQSIFRSNAQEVSDPSYGCIGCPPPNSSSSSIGNASSSSSDTSSSSSSSSSSYSVISAPCQASLQQGIGQAAPYLNGNRGGFLNGLGGAFGVGGGNQPGSSISRYYNNPVNIGKNSNLNGSQGYAPPGNANPGSTNPQPDPANSNGNTVSGNPGNGYGPGGNGNNGRGNRGDRGGFLSILSNLLQAFLALIMDLNPSGKSGINSGINTNTPPAPTPCNSSSSSSSSSSDSSSSSSSSSSDNSSSSSSDSSSSDSSSSDGSADCSNGKYDASGFACFTDKKANNYDATLKKCNDKNGHLIELQDTSKNPPTPNKVAFCVPNDNTCGDKTQYTDALASSQNCQYYCGSNNPTVPKNGKCE